MDRPPLPHSQTENGHAPNTGTLLTEGNSARCWGVRSHRRAGPWIGTIWVWLLPFPPPHRAAGRLDEMWSRKQHSDGPLPSSGQSALPNGSCLSHSELPIRGGIQRGLMHNEERCPEDLEVPPFYSLSRVAGGIEQQLLCGLSQRGRGLAFSSSGPVRGHRDPRAEATA